MSDGIKRKVVVSSLYNLFAASRAQTCVFQLQGAPIGHEFRFSSRTLHEEKKRLGMFSPNSILNIFEAQRYPELMLSIL